MRNAFIGLVLQKLVERFYLEQWWKEPDPVNRFKLSVFSTCQHYIDTEKLNFTPEERSHWMNIANEAAPVIVAAIRAFKLLSEEVYVEREEEVPFGEDKLQFRPDLVVMRDGEYTLLDGKGGGTYGRYVDNDQLYFYAGGLETVFKRLPDRLGFWWYRFGKIKWIKVNPEAVEEVRDRIHSVLTGIKKEQFSPAPGPHCRLCDYRVGCQKGKEFLDSRVRIADPVEIPGNFSEVGFGD